MTLHTARIACWRFEEAAAQGAEGELMLRIVLEAEDALRAYREELERV